MRFVFRASILGGLILVLLAPFAAAHVPIAPVDGDSLENAIEIQNPTKSWVIYSELHEAQEAKYFTFEMSKGERIRLMLSIPIHENSLFSPELALMGPGILSQGSLPSFVDYPNDTSVALYQSDSRDAEYEGFTPTSFYRLVDIDILAPETGRFYIAVYDDEEGGSISLAVGYVETFTIQEWIMVPISVLDIHQWNGQSLLMILLPFFVVPLIWLALYLRNPGIEKSKRLGFLLLGHIAAFLFVASGIAVFYQMAIATLNSFVSFQILITAAFGLIPILLGRYAHSLLSKDTSSISYEVPLKLSFLSLVALFTWSGLLVGPVLLLISSLGLLVVAKKYQSVIDVSNKLIIPQ